MTGDLGRDEFQNEDLRLGEIPVCFRALAGLGKGGVDAHTLVNKLAEFGCVADCSNCIVAKALEYGTEAVSDVLDKTSIAIVESVRRVTSEGVSLIDQAS